MPLKEDDLMDKKDPFAVDLTVDQAIRIIQKNERGRIGIQRALMVRFVSRTTTLSYVKADNSPPLDVCVWFCSVCPPGRSRN